MPNKMDYKNIIAKSIFSFFIVIIILGCTKPAENKPASEITQEIVDTGIIVVESSPSSAQVYVDNELKGESPLTVYNFPVGKHEVVVRKEGYEDFRKTITLEVGKTEEVSATLSEIMIATPKPAEKPVAEENKLMPKTDEKAALPSKLNKVNVNSSFITYYDFKNAMFTGTASASPDVFSSNYNTYLYFTAYSPATMRVLDKQIQDIKKEDCANAQDTIANLYTGQTLCVKTTNGNYAAIGGKWETSPSELYWVVFN